MRMKPITVKQLKKHCEEQIKKGNGDKVIMISSDDEGNSYHYLWYAFTTMEQIEEPIMLGDKEIEFPFEFADENIAKKRRYNYIRIGGVKMGRKYTMDEFEKMYLEAQKVVMKKLNQELENADKENKMDAMGSMMYNFHNMMVMAEMYKELFKKED